MNEGLWGWKGLKEKREEKLRTLWPGTKMSSAIDLQDSSLSGSIPLCYGNSAHLFFRLSFVSIMSFFSILKSWRKFAPLYIVLLSLNRTINNSPGFCRSVVFSKDYTFRTVWRIVCWLYHKNIKTNIYFTLTSCVLISIYRYFISDKHRNIYSVFDVFLFENLKISHFKNNLNKNKCCLLLWLFQIQLRFKCIFLFHFYTPNIQQKIRNNWNRRLNFESENWNVLC